MSTETVQMFKPGDWVRVSERNFALVIGAYHDGAIIAEFPGKEKLTLKHDSLKVGSAPVYLNEILKFAWDNIPGVTAEWLEAQHGQTAMGRDPMALDVLHELNKFIEAEAQRALDRKEMAVTLQVQWDKKGVDIYGTKGGECKRLTYKQLDKEIAAAETACDIKLLELLNEVKKGIPQDGKPTAAKLSPETASVVDEFLAKEAAKPTRSRRESHLQVVSNGQPLAEVLPEVTPEAQATLETFFPEGGSAPIATGAGWDNTAATVFDATPPAPEVEQAPDIFAQFGIEKEQIQPSSNVIDYDIEKPTVFEAQPAPQEQPTEDPKPLPIVDANSAPQPASAAVPAAVTAPAVAKSPIKTDAGLTDPETGEVYDESLILRKFGWTELPFLPKDREPTQAELDAFESKIDQVGDKIAVNASIAYRYMAQAEKRAAPYSEAASFWEKNFLIPMSEQLAPYRLPKYKTGKHAGEYREKTLNLPSISVSFTAKGGYYVHDKEMLIKHIESEGIEKFTSIDAKKATTYNHDKLMAEVKAGTLKDLPGVGHSPRNEFHKGEVKIPGIHDKPKKEVSDGVKQE